MIRSFIVPYLEWAICEKSGYLPEVAAIRLREFRRRVLRINRQETLLHGKERQLDAAHLVRYKDDIPIGIADVHTPEEARRQQSIHFSRRYISAAIR